MSTTSPARLEPRLVRLALLMSLGSFAAALDITVVGVAIDRLSDDLGGGIAAASWVTTGYLLALTAVLPLTGWVVGRIGTRRAWIGTLAVFLLGSALCGLAWSLPALVGFRVLQGLGGGMLLPLVRIVLAEQAGPERMGRLMTFVIVPAQLAPILGPVLGGLVVGGLDWRWAFLLNVPVCAVALALSARLVPAGSPAARTPLDVRGLLLLSTGLAALVYGLTASGAVAVTALVAGAVDAGRVHVARAAHPRHAGAGPAALPRPLVHRVLGAGVRLRRLALRRDVPAAAAVPERAGHGPAHRRPADGAAGSRRAGRDGRRRPAARPRRSRSCPRARPASR